MTPVQKTLQFGKITIASSTMHAVEKNIVKYSEIAIPFAQPLTEIHKKTLMRA